MTTAITLEPNTRVDVVNLGNTHYSLGNGWMIKPKDRLKDRLYFEVPERARVDAQDRPGRPARLAIVPAGSPLPSSGDVGPKPADEEKPKQDDEDLDLGGEPEEKVDLLKTPLRRGAQSKPEHTKGITPFDKKAEEDPLNPTVGTLPTTEGVDAPGEWNKAKKNAAEKKPSRRGRRR